MNDTVALGRRVGVALSDAELERIGERLGRVPTPTELFAFDAQWSEHCSYKSSRHHLRKLPVSGPTVILGPAEDAGIVRLGEWRGETYGIVIAHESHNHPSQVVPFEGAATGIGGIVRDVLCMGAEVIGIADPLRFGRLGNEHCRYVAQSVVDGIAAYGNAIGVPNLGGDVYIDESFDDNCLVNVVALGLVRERDIIHSRAPANSAGYDIVLVGKATDRSGFGGASFSSVTLDEEDAEANKGAVQVPDPFLKNVIMRASYAVFAALRTAGIEAGFKDLGAGGLAGCSGELCAAGGMGAEVDLDLVVTGQPDLPPEVIAIGETQERLCWIVPPSFTPELLRIYNDEYSLPRVGRGACAAVIGKVTDTKRYVARHRGEIVMDLDLDFLTGGVRYQRPYTIALPDPEPAADALARIGLVDIDAVLPQILAHRDVCSREAIFRRYDGVVRGTTAVVRGSADAGVIVPIPGAPLALALAVAGNPRLGKIDSQRAAEAAVVEAIVNVVAVGATPAGLTDCLNFGDPTVPEQLGDMVAAIDGLSYAARELAVPFVSGNVSLYNQSAAGRAIAPSPIVACVGSIADVAHTATSAFVRAGSTVFLVGASQPGFGGSVLADVLGVSTTSLVKFDYAALRREIAALLEAFAGERILAAHDVGDGGMLVSALEMTFGTLDEPEPIGIALDVAGDEVALLFGEYPAWLVEVTEAAAFRELCGRHGVTPRAIGTTIPGGDVRIDAHSLDVLRLYDAWKQPLSDFYGAVVA